jgi:L-gulonolactone oxidase
MSTAQPSGRPTWSNWAGNQVARPAAVVAARSTQEVRDVVRDAASAGQRVRPVGTGHSFTGLAVTDGVLLSLEHLSGVTAVDRESGRVRVLGGTPLHVLNLALDAFDLALPNLGDIDRQSISGAIATGTHGTGTRQYGIASAVTGLRLVLADGSVLQCSPDEHAEVFQAARVGLGALGVVTEVELQCVPAFRLRARERGESLSAVLERVQAEADAHDHLDLHWFPHTDRVLVKRNDRVPDDDPGRPLAAWRARLDDDLLSNRVFEAVNRVSARWPAVVPRLNQATSRALGAREYTDASWRVFCSSREVRFRESEYAVPRAAVVDVVRAVRDWVDRHDVALPFPVEVRFLGGDDVWLSTAYERDSAYVAVHQYHRMGDGGLFAAFEAIVAEHRGRPHWGKLHTLGRERLAELYPRFPDFLAVRDRLDPERLFGNDHLTRLLGP